MPNLRKITTFEKNWTAGFPAPHSYFDEDRNLLIKKGSRVPDMTVRDRILQLAHFIPSTTEPPPPRHREVIPCSELNLFDRIAEAANRLENLFRAVCNDTPIQFEERVASLAKHIQKSCTFDASLCFCVAYLYHSERYVLVHTLQSAILTELLAQHAGLKTEARHALVCAALTRDLFFWNCNKLQEQTGKLAPALQFHILRHPTEAVESLKNLGVTDQAWLTTILEHHERLDGSGYPHGLGADEISIGGKVLAVADSFSAMLHPRKYRKHYSPKEAFAELYLKQKHTYDPQLVAALIKIVGIYPAGMHVKLKDGRKAMLTSKATELVRAPFLAYEDANGMLMQHPQTIACKEDEIEAILPPHTSRLNRFVLEKIWPDTIRTQ